MENMLPVLFVEIVFVKTHGDQVSAWFAWFSNTNTVPNSTPETQR